MKRIVEVKPLADCRVWIRFADGVQGEVDLSHLAGKGVFQRWADPKIFRAVHVGAYGELAWDDEIDLCPDSLYLKLTGKTADEVFTTAQAVKAHA